MVEKILIDSNDSAYLERVQYEYETILDLITRNINTPSDYWTEKLIEAGSEFRLAKSFITDKYIKPKGLDLHKINWSLNYYDNELTIYEI